MKAEWIEARIGDVCLVTDYVANGSFAALRENVRYLDGGGYAVLVRLADSTKGWNGNYKYVSQSAYDFLRKSALIPGDLVMSNVGEPGKVFVVPDLGQPMTLGPNSVLIRPDPKHCANAFLYYYFSSPKGRTQVASISEGVAQKKFNKTAFRSLNLLLPPIGEQRRIVGILDEAFGGIATAKANAEKNLQNARALFESHLQSIFTEPGNGWEQRALAELCEVKDGTHDSPKYVPDGIPFVTQKNIKREGLSLEDTKFITRSDHDDFYRRSNVAYGDILISMIGANRGMACIVDDRRVFSIKNVGLVKQSDSINQHFLLYFLKSQTAIDYVSSRSKGGAQEFIGLTELRKFPVLTTSLPEQADIVAKLDSLSAATDRLAFIYEQKTSALDELKKSLLHQAFSGEL